MIRQEIAGDLSHLPERGYGSRSLTWWGLVGLFLIEGTGFALVIAIYFYLMAQAPHWPPAGSPPELLWGNAVAALLLFSELPNHWVTRVAKAENLKKVRVGLVVMSLIVIPILVLRWFEIAQLNVKWNDSAYGSAVWALLVMHTAHLVTDWADTIVLTVLMFTRRAGPRRFVDTTENALYWHFVVLSWLVLYLVIYWSPRIG